MTPRQREVLAVIHSARTVWGYAPSMRELAVEIGVESTNAVSRLLGCLEAQGLVTREPGKARTLRLTEAGREAMGEEG